MRKTIGVNTAFNVIYKLLNMLFPLITSVYLSRVLGPSYLGKISYAQSIVSYFVVIASIGIPTYGMREIAKNRNNYEKCSKLFCELFILNLGATILCSTIYTWMIWKVNSFHTDSKLFFAVGITLYLNVFNIDWFYSGNEEYVYITVRSFIIKVLALISILLFIKDFNHYIRYAVISSIAITGNYIWNVFNIYNKVHIQTRNIEIRIHLKPVIILLITTLATDLYNYIDITMLGLIKSDAEVGYYSNGIKIIRMICSICTTIGATILPRMCFYHKECKNEEYQKLFWQTFNVVILLAIPCMLGVSIIADSLVGIMFGNEFKPTAIILRILSPIILIIPVSYLCGTVILASTGNEKLLLKATISGAFVNCLFNTVLIPPLGINGAAIASIVGECVVFIIHLLYGKRYLKNELDIQCIVSIIISSVIMCMGVITVGIIIQPVWLELSLSVILGISMYCLMLYKTKNSIMKKILKVSFEKYKSER